MLVLSRKIGEKIIIGDNVSIEVLGIDRGQVRIGITAPIELTVDREEIYKRKKEGWMPKEEKDNEG